MKRLILASALCLAVSAATAQTNPPPAPPAPAAAASALASTPDVPLTKSGKPRAKEVRAACRDEVKAQGLKGEARKQAVADCVIKQRPDLAARMQCGMDPKAKGLDKDAKRAFVKDCVKGKS